MTRKDDFIGYVAQLSQQKSKRCSMLTTYKHSDIIVVICCKINISFLIGFMSRHISGFWRWANAMANKIEAFYCRPLLWLQTLDII